MGGIQDGTCNTFGLISRGKDLDLDLVDHPIPRVEIRVLAVAFYLCHSNTAHAHFVQFRLRYFQREAMNYCYNQGEFRDHLR